MNSDPFRPVLTVHRQSGSVTTGTLVPQDDVPGERTAAWKKTSPGGVWIWLKDATTSDDDAKRWQIFVLEGEEQEPGATKEVDWLPVCLSADIVTIEFRQPFP